MEGSGGGLKEGKEALQDVKKKEKAEGAGNSGGRTAVHPQRGQALEWRWGRPVTGRLLSDQDLPCSTPSPPTTARRPFLILKLSNKTAACRTLFLQPLIWHH